MSQVNERIDLKDIAAIVCARMALYKTSMSLDITPLIATGRQLIQRYGEGGFRVAGEDYPGSVMVLSEVTLPWDVQDAGEISLASLSAVLGAVPAPEILLVGCGPRFTAPPKELRAGLREKGIVLEWMDTGAACRTFNVLLAEERAAAAALIAVD